MDYKALIQAFLESEANKEAPTHGNGGALQASIQAELSRRKAEVIANGKSYVQHKLFADDVEKQAPTHVDGDKTQAKANADVKSNQKKALKGDYFKVEGNPYKVDEGSTAAPNGATGGTTDGVDPAKKLDREKAADKDFANYDKSNAFSPKKKDQTFTEPKVGG